MLLSCKRHKGKEMRDAEDSGSAKLPAAKGLATAKKKRKSRWTRLRQSVRPLGNRWSEPGPHAIQPGSWGWGTEVPLNGFVRDRVELAVPKIEGSGLGAVERMGAPSAKHRELVAGFIDGAVPVDSL